MKKSSILKRISAFIFAMLFLFTSLPIGPINVNADELKVKLVVDGIEKADIKVFDKSGVEMTADSNTNGEIVYSYSEGMKISIVPKDDNKVFFDDDYGFEETTIDGRLTYTKNLDSVNDIAEFKMTVKKEVLYNVSFDTVEGGTVKAFKDNTVVYDSTSDSSISVVEGTTLKLEMTPDSGKAVDSLAINDQNIDFSKVKVDEDNGVCSYTLSNITSNTNVKVGFATLETVKVNEAELTSNNISMKLPVDHVRTESSSEIKYILPKNGEVELQSTNGKKIALSKKVFFPDLKEKEVLSKSGLISMIYLEKGWSYKTVELKKGLRIVIDDEKPKVSVKGGKDYLNGTESKVTVEGTVSDNETVKKVLVYSVKPVATDLENDAKNDSEHDIEVHNGKFIYTNDTVPNSDTTYYVYAVDQSNNISDVEEKEYVFDNQKPEIVSIESNDTDISIGNGKLYAGNKTEEFTVKASDDKSGVKDISVYLNGELVDTKKADEEGKASFKITLDVHSANKVTAKCTDNAKNEMNEPFTYSQVEDGVTYSEIFYDANLPKVEVKNINNTFSAKTNDELTYYYKDKEPEFSVSVSNNTSRLKEVKLTLNGREVDKEFSTSKHKNSFGFTIDAKDIKEFSEVEVEVYARTKTGKERSVKFKVIKDTEAANISSVSSEDSVESISLLNEKTKSDRYSVFGKKVKLNYSVCDAKSGIKSVEVYTYDKDGNESNLETINVDSNPGEERVVPITLTKNVKNDVFVKVIDNVGNVTTDRVYKTSVGVINETEAKHKETCSIGFNEEKANGKDALGHKLYNHDTTVGIDVSDLYSGIKSIEYSVNAPYDQDRNYTGTVVSDTEGNITGSYGSVVSRDKNLVTKIRINLPVSNNSNDIVVTAKLTDNAGNVSIKKTVISIDKVAPAMSISFDETAGEGNYFKSNRVAHITVKERNLNPNDVGVNISNSFGRIPSLASWSVSRNEYNPDETVYSTSIVFVEDGDYTVSGSVSDSAGNSGNVFDIQKFTVDKTLPSMNISLDGNAANDNYFATRRTATITVNERNFDPNKVVVEGKASDNGSVKAFPTLSGWSNDGDKHTATISFEQDGMYSFKARCTDNAGNVCEAEQGEFYIDMTTPEITFGGVEKNSANSGTVTPTVTFKDTNYDSKNVSIKLTGAKQGEVKAEGGYSDSANGQTFTFSDFAHKKEVDDIYTLKATISDKAGNQFEDSMTFSVNRFGSVYSLDKGLKKIDGKYIKKPISLKFTETNVDELTPSSMKVTVSENGTLKDLKLGTDYSVEKSGGNGSWNQYLYTVKKHVFKNDAKYNVVVSSIDQAGNNNQNTKDGKDAVISFGIDRTAPIIEPLNVSNGKSINKTELNANIEVKDNLVLDDVAIKVDGKDTKVKNDGEIYTVNIKESAAKQNLVITAIDKAGNKTSYKVDDLIVSTNVFVRLFNNTILFAAAVFGLLVVLSVTVGLVLKSKSGVVNVKTSSKK